MAGTLVIKYYETRSVRRVIFNWTSNASGTCTGQTKLVSGIVSKISFIPASGVNQPSDDYKVKILDDDGIDIIQGYGFTGMSNEYPDAIVPQMNGLISGSASLFVVDGKLNFEVVEAGNAKQGIVTVYLR